MNRKEAIQTLKELRSYAVGREWACDVEALTAGIEALSARDPDRTGRLRRDSKMLEQILEAVAATAYESERSMLDAIMAYWRRGEQAQTPIECIALDDYRKECLWHVRPGNIDSRKEIISQAALMMLEDVYPEAAGKEAKTDDNQ